MEEKTPKLQRKARVAQAVSRIVSTPPSRFDPDGSYTGKPMDTHEKPVQDADDL